MKVLVVDDSKTIRALVTQCISSLSHEVEHAENGEEALEFIKLNAVDLVMMDVEMPGMNGFETTQKIREMQQDDWFPIIFLTTKVDDDSYASGILAGGDAYLAKPINPLRLQLQITAMERIYRTRQKLKQAQQDLEVANKELLKMSMFDQLTNLANRRNFDITLEKQFKLAKREKSPLSLIICDIDFFKIYNDNYGHQQGDDCLKQVAATIGQIPYRPTDLACRYGGEEFTVIIPNTNLQGGLHVAEQIRLAVWEKDLAHSSSKIASRITLSLGVATYNGHFKLEDELTHAADQALYRAKENGRNRVESA